MGRNCASEIETADHADDADEKARLRRDPNDERARGGQLNGQESRFTKPLIAMIRSSETLLKNCADGF